MDDAVLTYWNDKTRLSSESSTKFVFIQETKPYFCDLWVIWYAGQQLSWLFTLINTTGTNNCNILTARKCNLHFISMLLDSANCAENIKQVDLQQL